MNKSPNSFYVTGGTLRRDAPSYVPRQADQDLYEGLRQGKFCYVLTSRQMGKSSLMVRTAARLREEGATVAILDLTRTGQNLTPEQWYDGLLGQLGEQLNLAEELEAFWLSHDRLGPLDRWMRAVREIVLPRRAGQIVIFVDEIDAVRSLPFSTDEFFAAIRECYNRRTEAPDLARLTFCLLGVATPSDLIRDTRTTPFNIGQRIELNDFTESEAAPLAEGLGRDERTAQKLLSRILYWTGGHPYLTQRLCQAVAEDAAVTTAGGVDRLCEELFFTTRARERDDNLLFVRERMLRSEGDLAGLLDLYAQVRRNKRVRDDETSPVIGALRLSGITSVIEGRLGVRNRIYEGVFDREWVSANMPDAELRRQRAAYRRGMLRTAGIAGIVLALMSALIFTTLLQRDRAESQGKRADQLLYEVIAQRNLAKDETQRAEMALVETKQLKEKAEIALAEAELQRKKADAQRIEAESQRQQVVGKDRVVEEKQRQIDLIGRYIWESAKRNNNPVLFQAYLDLFPSGEFASVVTQESGLLTGAFEGIVFEAGTDKPIVGVRVAVAMPSTGLSRVRLTDKRGRFYFGLLTPGIYAVTFSHEMYETIRKEVRIKITMTTSIPGGIVEMRRNT